MYSSADYNFDQWKLMFKRSHFPSVLVGYVITQRFIAKT